MNRWLLGMLTALTACASAPLDQVDYSGRWTVTYTYVPGSLLEKAITKLTLSKSPQGYTGTEMGAFNVSCAATLQLQGSGGTYVCVYTPFVSTRLQVQLKTPDRFSAAFTDSFGQPASAVFERDRSQ